MVARLWLDVVLFQYSIDPSSGFSVVVVEDSSQLFPSYDRPLRRVPERTLRIVIFLPRRGSCRAFRDGSALLRILRSSRTSIRCPFRAARPLKLDIAM